MQAVAQPAAPRRSSMDDFILANTSQKAAAPVAVTPSAFDRFMASLKVAA